MNEAIAKTLLHKLFRHGYIGAKHTAMEILPKGFPKHLHKEAMKTVRKLTKSGFLILKPTSYGMHVSLNPRKIAEIEEKIRDP